MQDEYKKPYHILFNGVTDALAALEECNYGTVKALLIQAQQQAEEAYISEGTDAGTENVTSEL